MKTKNILGHNKRLEFLQRVGFSAALFLGAFVVTFLTVSSFAPASDSSATNMKLTNNTVGQYVNISSLGTIDINLTASPEGGTSIGKDVLTVNTNVHSGYRIYISTPEDAEDTGLHHTDSSVTQEISAASGTSANPSKLDKNSWGYSMGRKSGTDSARLYTESNVDPDNGENIVAGVPDYNDTEIAYHNLSPTVEETNTVDVFYSVNADTSFPSGSYQANVLYSAIIEDAEWNEASVAPANQKGIASGKRLTIATDLYPGGENPSYGTILVKVGNNTCTNPTPVVTESGNLNITCIAPAQDKAGKYDVTVSIGGYHRDYKIKDGYEYIYEHIGILQNFDCSSIDIDEEIRLRDTRDNNVYRVKRLKDGNCWLMDDLRIAGPRTLTPEDTDITTGSFTLGDSDQSYWCTDSTAECINQIKYYDRTNDGAGMLYNWYTATAGTGRSDTQSGELASGSICPKGWSLPKDETTSSPYPGRTDEYHSLALVYARDRLTSDSGTVLKPNLLELNSGWIYGSFVDSLGYYWTGTAGYTTSSGHGESYYVSRYSYETEGGDGININSNDLTRNYGMYVRCVVSSPMGAFSCADIPEIEGTKELIDMRTGYSYTVVKAKDGKCWSTRNQDLTLYNTSYGSMNYYYTISNASRSFSLGLTGNDWCLPSDTGCSMAQKYGRYGDTGRYHLDSKNKSYGTYYGWEVAASGDYDSNRDTNTKTAKYSFCPNNWRMPTKEEWQGLYNSYGSTKALLDSPLNFEFAGYHLGNETLKAGMEGYFWSGSYEDENNSYAFKISKDGYSIDRYNNRYGFSLRCIASN